MSKVISRREALGNAFIYDMARSEALRKANRAVAEYGETISAAFTDLDQAATDAIKATRAFGDTMEAVTESLVTAARAEGESWEQIGEALGMTRQSAHKKYAHLVDSPSD